MFFEYYLAKSDRDQAALQSLNRIDVFQGASL
jgi:hypothetical protein